MPRTDSPTPPSKKTRLILSFIFLFIVLCSAIGLDYIHWKGGNKSYLFYLLETPPIQEDIEALDQLILNSLTSLGIQADLTHSKKDERGRIQIPISMAHTEYKNVASLEEPNPIQPKNKVALIIDDMGYSLKTLRDLEALGLSLTIAILPYSPWAKETAQVAQQNNMEVILHLPLESLNDFESNSLTEGLIHSRMSEKDVLEILEANLTQVPFIRGVNNHMGSKITAEREIMSLILARLKEDNLYFIDSVTSGSSIAFKLAREMSVSSAYRHVFLDSETEEGYIRKQLIQLLRQAQRRGMAVGICHPYASTLKVLSENLDLFEQYNCETVFASQIVK